MAIVFPSLENVSRLTVKPTAGEMHLLNFLINNLDDSYEIFFNPFLDGDRPDFVILKKGVGVFIIEVKDWNINAENYMISLKNEWFFNSDIGYKEIKSPFAQAFHYKKNFYEIHVPLIGIKNILNPNFYNVVDAFVYFHCTDKATLEGFYDDNLKVINDFVRNYSSGRNYNFAFTIDKVEYYRNKLKRDKRLSIFKNYEIKIIDRILSRTKHPLFTDDLYIEFKRRLLPSEFILSQGKRISLDKKQFKLAGSQIGLHKIKGVAGSGKTAVLVARAIKSLERINYNDSILILTYNLSLKNYLKFRLYDLLRNISNDEFNSATRDFFDITNYHKFYISQANNLNIKIQPVINNDINDKQFLINIFQDNKTKYPIILVDEIQDYEPEWIKIVRDCFLAENGEMVLFGDQTQNIYKRDINKREISLVDGFGRWQNLNRSYRSCYKLTRLFSEFKQKFLEDYKDEENYELKEPKNYELILADPNELLKYIRKDFTLKEISDYIRAVMQENNLIQNDCCILSSKIQTLQKIENEFSKFEKTTTSFETLNEILEIKNAIRQIPNEQKRNEVLKIRITRLRQLKKNFFSLNSGLVKFSTTHSFKGLELKNIFLIIDESDNDELVYTAITRSIQNLFIINLNKQNTYDNFFENFIYN